MGAGDLTTLAHFVRVAEVGSPNAAAGALHVAQPTLSRQMAALERDLGARLFVRHRRGVSLTAAGEQLRAHAERIVGEMQRARGAVSASAQEPRRGRARPAGLDALRAVPAVETPDNWITLGVHEDLLTLVEGNASA